MVIDAKTRATIESEIDFYEDRLSHLKFATCKGRTIFDIARRNQGNSTRRRN